MPPENTKNTFFEVMFDSEQPHKIFFRKFWLIIFLRNKVWNQPIHIPTFLQNTEFFKLFENFVDKEFWKL